MGWWDGGRPCSGIHDDMDINVQPQKYVRLMSRKEVKDNLPHAV